MNALIRIGELVGVDEEREALFLAEKNLPEALDANLSDGVSGNVAAMEDPLETVPPNLRNLPFTRLLITT